MKLNMQKKLAASILKCSPKRIKFNEEMLGEIKEAITRADIGSLISRGIIFKIKKKGVSKSRARLRHIQKKKGRRKGKGKRKGTQKARNPKKRSWMNRIRAQREYLNLFRKKKLIDDKVFKDIYQRASGGFFRNRRHIKLYLNEQRLFKNKLLK